MYALFNLKGDHINLMVLKLILILTVIVLVLTIFTLLKNLFRGGRSG